MADDEVVPRFKPMGALPEALPSTDATPATLSESVQPRFRPMFGADTKTGSYPDMTPGPPPKITQTSFASVPNRENEGGFWSDLWHSRGPDQYRREVAQREGAFTRAGQAGQEAYTNTPDVFPPQLQEKAERNLGWLGGPIASGAMGLVNKGVKGGAALGTTAMADIAELLSQGDPQQARDFYALQQILPVAHAGVPRYTGPPGVKVNVPPGEGPGPMGPYPMARQVLKTPEDVQPFKEALFKQADESGRVVGSDLTTGFMTDLNKYAPQSETGIHTAGPNAVSDLVGRLRKISEKPITSMQGIEDIDNQIRDAISENYDNKNFTRQMNGILQDFRARVDQVAPEFRPAMQASAAQHRMRAVQDIIDTTEDSPNRAQRIATKVLNFTNDKKNVRGWTDAEIDELRSAGRTGLVTDWMKTQGSRLGTIIASTAISPLTGVINFGSGAAARTALDNLRVARLERAMAKHGERVQQPGRVTLPTEPQLPRSLGTVARYGPLMPMLGESVQED